nr:immunoglobulin light chain junction region [Macaca mulatta]MPN86833.1 immunoglobulin light chain junction region [Macaca mulatta]MPN86843.1 immunoglobulin light chain junction region [Macaca mulatta]MPN87228.1 immunoglobulin light chain junction region [Macaca mulatta]MPN87658.1 immunoglobulin light chain junction region [Macaca mulatta]
CMHALQTPYSF